jgi:hypothetical protein
MRVGEGIKGGEDEIGVRYFLDDRPGRREAAGLHGLTRYTI